ncbi:diaminopimelate decarboxylase [Companilactobacillus sp.]|jgi:diaminopimelate decarboxylase|uniref:diaminopimelate decarboxylase n=1 Tax=Companilactobacillus sp. TaxID=2767905 RepID=UPI0025BE1F19|nr:diaminopimelate decarboxylase [Companilactobacillus sp.]MCH4007895.1 diaminopimelate decarboxylase [Companilactobacillus sp.]MCH4051926.1 diaminopimelate decarboxylase [Companilactobacillus sp.]MCH4075838.1 diaminopimelate decarboxylase [Companilactobacillus sp.]MCH4124413.1 diaminopimelate decarboxylase [Companilactobacillus sp.]MCH4132624.1 diaminopimelate decarboxylase [Companilactobacillus sp.]
MISSELNSDSNGHLILGGVDSVELAHKYGTPLVVYDVEQIRKTIGQFKQSFEDSGVKYEISYASKAFATVAMYQVLKQEELHTDVVSGGELYTALQAGFPANKISFHGNNKSRQELEMAVDNHIGVIILDNFYEIKLLKEILEEKDTNINVMLRLTPGISAHTHEYIQTGQVDSKFGFDVQSDQHKEALEQVLAIPQMNLIGIHAHIGSQIFGVDGFTALAKKLVDISADFKNEYDYTPQILNLGGGFGISYTDEDEPIGANVFIDKIISTIKEETKSKSLDFPEIWIEPGRSIVGPAGFNLYTVGSRKDIPGLLSYVNVDGGMGDNIRPALYQAKYEAVVANKMNADIEEEDHIAGKYCESGDILIDRQALPKVEPGDVIAMLDTGAYGYSMASNYNRNPRPAVVFVENGKDKLVVKRESYEDLVRLDQSYI